MNELVEIFALLVVLTLACCLLDRRIPWAYRHSRVRCYHGGCDACDEAQN